VKTENEARSLQNRLRQELKKYIKIFPNEDGVIFIERKKKGSFYIVTLERIEPFKRVEIIYPEKEN
jgi:hypothetical protein